MRYHEATGPLSGPYLEYHRPRNSSSTFEDVNDPKALIAVRKGTIAPPYVFDLGRVSAPALVYCGGDDDPDEVMPTAQALHTEVHVLEGCDHVGAFMEVDSVMPFAVAFLDTAAPS
ncbi:MAG: hypothetical protein JJE47_06385 [Acidimicrobiia bacterium]|nr:hypothetical protein [Acidimicrobiia bacterium]